MGTGSGGAGRARRNVRPTGDLPGRGALVSQGDRPTGDPRMDNLIATVQYNRALRGTLTPNPESLGPPIRDSSPAYLDEKIDWGDNVNMVVERYGAEARQGDVVVARFARDGAQQSYEIRNVRTGRIVAEVFPYPYRSARDRAGEDNPTRDNRFNGTPNAHAAAISDWASNLNLRLVGGVRVGNRNYSSWNVQ